MSSEPVLPQRKPPRPTTLYRLFAQGGTLLYIGIGGNPGRRFEQHAADKPWWSEVSRVTVEHFPDRPDALAAELNAIRKESPKYNVEGQPGTLERRMPTESSRRQDRLSNVAESPLSPDSLVGSFFLTSSSPGWQGCVVAEPAPGVYLVETFSWVAGESYEQKLMRLEEMLDWHFYDDDVWMRNAYEHEMEERWQRERRDASKE